MFTKSKKCQKILGSPDTHGVLLLEILVIAPWIVASTQICHPLRSHPLEFFSGVAYVRGCNRAQRIAGAGPYADKTVKLISF